MISQARCQFNPARLFFSFCPTSKTPESGILLVFTLPVFLFHSWILQNS